MRNVMILSALLFAAGISMAWLADEISIAAPAKAALMKAAAMKVPEPAAAGDHFVSIPRDSRGHFQADGRIAGQRINFMVDTGASVVALTENDAARIGVRPARGDYTATVGTANGNVKAAPVRLASVDVGGVVVRDVDAMVLPDGVLNENLLGLSFLSKLKRFEYANGRMVLE